MTTADFDSELMSVGNPAMHSAEESRLSAVVSQAANIPQIADVERPSLQDTAGDLSHPKLPTPACAPASEFDDLIDPPANGVPSPLGPTFRSTEPLSGSLAISVPQGKSTAQYERAQQRLTAVDVYRRLLSAGNTPNAAAQVMKAAGLKGSRSRYDAWLRAFTERGFEGLFDNAEKAGRKPELALHDSERKALKAARLKTNRTREDGSTPEAVRLAERRGDLRPEMADRLIGNGRRVPRALHNQMVAGAAVTRQHRNPTDAGLDYLNSPGALMWLNDERTGQERFIKAGDILEADDATINFPVVIPWEIGGNPCAERWGVMVARFQWLVAIDRATRFVPGYSYVVRPRSSYRAEDITALFHRIFAQHGIWQRVCLERASWEAEKVSAMLAKLGVERLTAWSPHQKPFIEGLFNLIWTKLSDMPGQVGRFRGEEEKMNAILTSCQSGATDPRKHFPMLSDAIKAFDRALFERNEQQVKSAHWGSWIPQQRWLAQQEDARATGRLRPLPAEAAWLFAPQMEEWTVRGNLVGGTVPIMDGVSVRFDFSAEWLTDYVGAKVRVHFDPAAPRCEAVIVLAEPMRGQKRGEVLGTALQVNKTARYARRAMGWGDDADMGLQMRQQAASALRREVRTILPNRQIGSQVSEMRDGLGSQIVIERGGESTAPEAAPVPDLPVARGDASLTPPSERRGTNPFRFATEDEAATRAKRNAALLAAAQALPQ